jgi:hypothetical protein
MRMRKIKFITLSWATKICWALLIVITASCDLFRFKSDKEDEADPIVASIDQQVLRKSDLTLVNTQGLSASDSSSIINRYIQSWIRKQLMIREASRSMAYDEAEINRKLLDYKYALMVYEYEKAYLDSHLDTNIPEQEIVQYYEANKQNFNLKEIIVRINFVKIERNHPQNRSLERLLRLQEGEQKDALNKIVVDFAANYFLEDATWVKVDDIIANSPLADSPNLVGLLRNNKLIIVEDERYKYYFRILEYKLADQVPPIEFVKDEIYQILLNKRKIQLVEELQKEIYNRALENNEFKIYE